MLKEKICVKKSFFFVILGFLLVIVMLNSLANKTSTDTKASEVNCVSKTCPIGGVYYQYYYNGVYLYYSDNLCKELLGKKGDSQDLTNYCASQNNGSQTSNKSIYCRVDKPSYTTSNCGGIKCSVFTKCKQCILKTTIYPYGTVVQKNGTVILPFGKTSADIIVTQENKHACM